MICEWYSQLYEDPWLPRLAFLNLFLSTVPSEGPSQNVIAIRRLLIWDI